MNKKKIVWYFIFVFLMALSYFVPEISFEYKEFHLSKNNIEALKHKNFDVDLSSINEIEGVEIFSTPDLSYLDKLVQKINWAENRVYLQTYIFTEKRIRKALINAYKRWVDVKVMLEKEIYNAPNLNYDAYKDLTWEGIEVKWATDEFSLVHSKLLIVDDKAIIGTGNFSYSTFKKNRDFFIEFEKKEEFDVILHNFLTEFNKKYDYKFDENIVKSPFNTREKFNELFTKVKQNVRFYIQNFSDKETFESIKSLLNKGIEVEIIIPSYKRIKNNEKYIEPLIKLWAKIYFSDKPYIHAKAMLVDDEILYIWSINFSYYSIEKNWEIWLILKDKEIIKEFLKIFKKDIN